MEGRLGAMGEGEGRKGGWGRRGYENGFGVGSFGDTLDYLLVLIPSTTLAFLVSSLHSSVGCGGILTFLCDC